MALTYVDRAYVPLAEGEKLVAVQITGDGSTTTVPAIALKLQYVKFAFVININETTPVALSTNFGSTLTYAAAFESGQEVLLVAIGY
jgi:hypothetical protein